MAPKIEMIARGVLIQNNRILLCQAVKSGYYYLPGGHVEFGEPAAQALAREIQEETGLDSTIGPFLLATEQSFSGKKRRHHEMNVVFHVEQIESDEVVSQEDDLAFEWVDLTTIQKVDLRPQEIKDWIHTRSGHWISGIPSINES